jgi:ParB-like chromosome segregation protein Spo0J
MEIDFKTVELISSKDLIPYDSNPREHSEEQIQQVAKSIKEFGWTMPILVDENLEIIAGHGRLLASQKLNIDKVPCMIARGWTEDQKKAYCIADNKLTENSTWANEDLKLNLTSLLDNNFDLRLTGFNQKELDNILNFDIDTIDTEEQTINSQYQLTVELQDETEQEGLYNELTQRGLKCKVLSF